MSKVVLSLVSYVVLNTHYVASTPQPSMSDFHSAFQVVFIDPSGHLNLCADMTPQTYKQVRLKMHDEPA